MQVRLLGPVDVVTGDEPRPVPGLRRKAVLAALALHDGEIVSTGRLWRGPSLAELAGLDWFDEQADRLELLRLRVRRALVEEILRELGDRNTQAHTCDSLGYIYHRLGRERQATAYYRQALDLFRATGDPYSEAHSLSHLGDSHDAAGDADAARRAWTQSLNILSRLDHPDANQVRAKLRPRAATRF